MRPAHHRRACLVPIAVLVLLLASAPAATAGPLALPLQIRSSAPGVGPTTPVAASVPFPPGRLRDAQGLWLAAGGAPVPRQTTVLERWPDGSIRWLRVDALADLRQRAETTLTLREGTAPRGDGGPRVAVAHQGGGLAIDSGALRFALPASGDALLTNVRTGDVPAVARVALPVLDAGGEPLTARLAGDAVVEADGPVRAEVLLRARYPNAVALEARVAAFAGQPWVRLQLTLTSLSNEPWLRIRSFRLDVPGAFDTGGVGVDGKAHRWSDLEQPHTLRQPDAETALLDGAAAGAAGDGWVRATGASAAVTLVRRWFPEEYPQVASATAGGVTIDLVAAGDEPLALGRGGARTFDLWLAVERPDAASDPAALAAALRGTPMGLPPARWIVASGALAQSLDPDAPGAASFLRRLEAAVRRYLARARHERWDDGEPAPCEQRARERERRGFYGVLNWGDWNFPGYRDKTKGCDAWGNLEYDLTQVLGLAWAATGDLMYRDAFLTAARHYRDVDVIHHDPEHPEYVGLNHPHKAGHNAPEARQSVDLGHTWLEGLITHWRLTGEVRSQEAAVRMADALAGRLGKAGNPRHFGWPMIALAAAATSTNEARYRRAATGFAEAARLAFPPDPAAADWKIGIQADGLAAVDALGPAPEIRQWLVRYADALLASGDGFADPRYALPLGWLATVTGDRRYADRALSVATSLEIGEWGKTLASDGRTGFRLLGPLAAEAAVPGRGAGAGTGRTGRATSAEPPARNATATRPPAPGTPPPTWGPPPTWSPPPAEPSRPDRAAPPRRSAPAPPRR